MITYTEDGLVIKIETPSPEACHNNLMSALVATMRWFSHAEVTNGDKDKMYYLAELMEQIIPQESQLSCK